MTEALRIAMTFPAPPERVFAFLTERRHVLDWWGPEGMSLSDESLDFTREGPWHSVMLNADGRRFKVSGQVTEVARRTRSPSPGAGMTKPTPAARRAGCASSSAPSRAAPNSS